MSFILSCGGKLGLPHELQWGSGGTPQVAKMESSLLSSCLGELGISLEVLQGNRASPPVQGVSCGIFRVAAGSFGFLSSCEGNLGNLCYAKSEPSLLPSCEGELGIAFVSLK